MHMMKEGEDHVRDLLYVQGGNSQATIVEWAIENDLGEMGV